MINKVSDQSCNLLRHPQPTFRAGQLARAKAKGRRGTGRTHRSCSAGAGTRGTMISCSKPCGLVSLTSFTSRVTKPARVGASAGGAARRTGSGEPAAQGHVRTGTCDRAHTGAAWAGRPGHWNLKLAAPILPLIRRRFMTKVRTCGRNVGKSSIAGSPTSTVPT